MSDILIYNPRMYNRRPSVDVKQFSFNRTMVEGLPVNSMKRYPENVGEEMLRRWQFLRRIEPEQASAIMEDIKKEVVYCEFCDYYGTKKEVGMHINGKHKLSKEARELLNGVPAAQTSKIGTHKEASDKVPTPEELEGIPDTSRGEVDNWYGKGLEVDGAAS